MRVALVVLLALGCSESTEREPLLVFAASSLTDAFEELERAYEAAHPTVDVQSAFAGSQVLRLQIEHGAPADVFASADPMHVEALVESHHAEGAQTFAHNELALIVPRRAGAIDDFAQLDRASRIVVGTPNVPVGRYTQQLLERTRATHGEAFISAVRGAIVSEESNVRLVRAKVELGEADAAFVYRTDVSEGVRAVSIPDELRVSADYPIALLRGSEHPEAARTFVDFVRGPDGRAILERRGFRVEAP